MDKIILIKYGELTTKKQNRKQFINLLDKNIQSILKDNKFKMIKNRDRMFIETDEYNDVIEKLKKVFGIHRIVLCHKTNTNIDDIKALCLEVMNSISFKTFKVETKRAYKGFTPCSSDMNNLMGGLILSNINCKVDVHNPEVLLHIEIREDYTYVYTNEIKGLGGYPVGVQGKGLLMLSGGIDSPVAGYMALKRGIDIDCLYFESPPHTSLEAKNKVLKLASIINNYSGNIRVHVVPFTTIQEEIYKHKANDYMITIMRRMMYRIADKYSRKMNYKAIINGESIGQVASQTLDSMDVINEVTNLPVIRPVACFDKLEIIDIANKIDTYETSILPFEDCCTIFLPDHPVIKPKLDRCIEIEKRFDYESLIDDAINNITIYDKFNTVDDSLL